MHIYVVQWRPYDYFLRRLAFGKDGTHFFQIIWTVHVNNYNVIVRVTYELFQCIQIAGGRMCCALRMRRDMLEYRLFPLLDVDRRYMGVDIVVRLVQKLSVAHLVQQRQHHPARFRTWYMIHKIRIPYFFVAHVCAVHVAGHVAHAARHDVFACRYLIPIFWYRVVRIQKVGVRQFPHNASQNVIYITWRDGGGARH